MDGSVIGRRVVERGTHTPIGRVIDWRPLTAALTDTLVKFAKPNRYGHRECWYSLRELRAVDDVDGKGELPRRDEAIIEAEIRTLESLTAIRELWMDDDGDFRKPWPGCEFGKVHLGNAINGAIERTEREVKKRKLGLVQHIPREPEPLFQLIEPQPGANYYHVKIKDAIIGDEPEFRKALPKSPKSRANWPTPQQVANAGAGELNEARGIVSLTRYEDGIPVFSAQYAANSREVYCLWSTDEEMPSVKNGLISLTPPWLDEQKEHNQPMQLIDPSDIFNSLVRLSDWAYRQGESRLKSPSGADQSESELYIEESRFWQRVAGGCPVSQALRLSALYWQTYCDEIQQRIASAPKISHRGHPREGQSVIEHRYVDVEMWTSRVRNVIDPWLSRAFVDVDANDVPHFSHPTYNELDREPKPSIRYFARYRVERDKRDNDDNDDNGGATQYDSLRYSLLFGPFREYRTVIDLINNLIAGIPARPQYGQDIVACSIRADIVKRYSLRGRLNNHPTYNELYRNAFLKESKA